ncbi:MAG: hypothetical protein V3S33_02320, partial [Gammaproteobacteria bacterium]
IALDTFPYNGTTTTCEALWMGVPVITLVGEAHVQRVSYSILTNIGKPELAAHTESEYIEKATRLATSDVELKEIRADIGEKLRSSILCDSLKFTRQLEAAYRDIWGRYIENSEGGH